jgi:alpha-beta hydrolase superfamily lysophospholipase
MPKQYHGRVVLIHGAKFKKRDRDNLRKIAIGFRATGFCVVLPTYGYLPSLMIGLFQWLDRRIADAMSAFIGEDDILLGHSNGGTLVYLISKRTKIKGAILVNAALDSDKLPDAKFIHVYYNEGDVISKLSALIPFHPWGSMGGEGYSGSQPHVVNIDQGHPPNGLPPLNGHSDIFKHGKVRPWSRFMAELCLKALDELPR